MLHVYLCDSLWFSDELAASILIVGDYELQVCILEALCHMTPAKDRGQRAKDWFNHQDTIDAFCRIRHRL
ncbi:unnamed protein product [Arctogadus glacialis]